jgi:hypothetical protein
VLSEEEEDDVIDDVAETAPPTVRDIITSFHVILPDLLRREDVNARFLSWRAK